MTQPLSIAQLFAAFSLVLGVVFVSRFLRLELERSILLAAVRATVQLCVLGYVLLVPIFAAQSAPLVLAYLAFVILIAAHEASSKPAFLYEALHIHALVAIGGSACVVLAFAVTFVLCPHPWWEPQYLIPVAGMVVGNSISSFSLGLGRFLSAIKQRSSEVKKAITVEWNTLSLNVEHIHGISHKFHFTLLCCCAFF
jgi:putative ABC transport system permease protein